MPPETKIFDKLQTDQWRRRVGKLPAGFFLRVSGQSLHLFYQGRGYESLTQSGGKKPSRTATEAYICSHNINFPEKRVLGFIREQIARIQKQLSAGRQTA